MDPAARCKIDHGHDPQRYVRQMQEREPDQLPRRARSGMDDRGARPLAAAVPRMLRCRGGEGRCALQLRRSGRDELVGPAGTEGVTVEAKAIAGGPIWCLPRLRICGRDWRSPAGGALAGGCWETPQRSVSTLPSPCPCPQATGCHRPRCARRSGAPSPSSPLYAVCDLTENLPRKFRQPSGRHAPPCVYRHCTAQRSLLMASCSPAGGRFPAPAAGRAHDFWSRPGHRRQRRLA